MTTSAPAETTLLLVKPDGVRRGLVGEIISRLERKHLTLVAIRMVNVDEDLARRHYHLHLDKTYFPQLLKFITSGPVVAVAVRGPNAIQLVRKVMGATDPQQAAPGTIRGDYALDTTENLVHGSDGMESAHHELGLFFPDLFAHVEL